MQIGTNKIRICISGELLICIEADFCKNALMLQNCSRAKIYKMCAGKLGRKM